MKQAKFLISFIIIIFLFSISLYAQQYTYPIVDTGQEKCYNNLEEITAPNPGESFYGQDAQFDGNQPDYTDNGDGTITDNVTGLMWQQGLFDEKMTYDEAVAGADTFSLAGYDDWRLPTIKELYSLIVFNGIDPSGWPGTNTDELTPFIDTTYFAFRYGDTSAGDRIIDSQYASSTEYVWTTMNGDFTIFGVNFADGRIKGYGTVMPKSGGEEKTFEVKYVRGNCEYGINEYTDNGDGTISDVSTGLMWSQDDSGEGLNWEEALAWVETKNAENYLGYNDWRLPNVKELQSIVDYTRAPDVTNSAAIDSIFNVSSIVNVGGETDYPYFWSGTTHENMTNGDYGCYVSFGRALGWMEVRFYSRDWQLMDVHGAGAQRSDPKSGNPDDWPHGHGPQGDVIRIYNYVRLVRDISTASVDPQQGSSSRIKLHKSYPNPTKNYTHISFSSSRQIASPEIAIYNIIGQKMIVLSCDEQTSEDGYRYFVQWNCKDQNGNEVPNGVYLYNVIADNSIVQADKLIITK